MKRLLTYVVAILAVTFAGQLIANPAAYAVAAPTVQQCKDAYAGLAALKAAGWPTYVITANKSIIDQKCAGVYRP
ncbi:MAG TPA: hypothetical protein VN748_11320 [Pseudonocardiaceae bacterium]|jgi:hypothetical protein|nr:hypothetical protein [Pseudonocardiaceae bacterium]